MLQNNWQKPKTSTLEAIEIVPMHVAKWKLIASNSRLHYDKRLSTLKKRYLMCFNQNTQCPVHSGPLYHNKKISYLSLP